MDLLEKCLAVNELFTDLEIATRQFISQGQLNCLQGCSKCCANPKVPATALEFLPLAFELYHAGNADATLDKLELATEDSFCILLNHLSAEGTSGLCSHYSQRGLICRLFGSSARRNREGLKELVTCKLIKEHRKEQYEAVSTAIREDLEVPGSTDYYTRLYGIDFHLAGQQYPINLAIKKALEAVISYYFYTEGEAV
ncbi:YkgJ family cysteine cluster protein [Echinicola strongylocentroti]|uniref:YkgJ family cysteine cluster protein n=1 Tax=Echinicola strongylocentroti TaxID=1795355 RepID=A0A2Z4IIH7_9BACT|nr:YkgJ family cysteine cluster protein [Echinicola strongylocentroti]AWW30932.1 YkgJ family cysteine cluster protein [Echinicola strongylocentroti]